MLDAMWCLLKSGVLREHEATCKSVVVLMILALQNLAVTR